MARAPLARGFSRGSPEEGAEARQRRTPDVVRDLRELCIRLAEQALRDAQARVVDLGLERRLVIAEATLERALRHAERLRCRGERRAIEMRLEQRAEVPQERRARGALLLTCEGGEHHVRIGHLEPRELDLQHGYQKVWEENELRVVAIFGKYEKSGTTAADAGIDAFNTFAAQMRTTLGALQLTTEPATVPPAPGVNAPDITFHATLADGKKVTVNALLVDEISSAPESFYTRYESLSAKADIIAYNGHAGLGQNVRALANRGRFVTGQYLILFMNGCDTFAYVDGSLAQKRASINADDPTGTKYMDIVTNAMPAYFMSDSPASTALITGLMTAPKSYEEIFASIDTSQVVLVTGEEDNVFRPGMPIGPGGGGDAWAGLNENGSVAQSVETRYQTPELPAGAYTFAMTGTGDADLYVRRGAAPTTASWDCRPYRNDSNETCTVTLDAPAPIYVMVRGYAAASTFTLVGK